LLTLAAEFFPHAEVQFMQGAVRAGCTVRFGNQGPLQRLLLSEADIMQRSNPLGLLDMYCRIFASRWRGL
jgi:hypothetical protein